MHKHQHTHYAQQQQIAVSGPVMHFLWSRDARPPFFRASPRVAACLLKLHSPKLLVEVLTPDFRGDHALVAQVATAGLDV